MNKKGFGSAFSLAEAYPATVVAATLAGKTLRAGMLFGASRPRPWNKHFTL